jgi:hypothetical protein
MHPVRTKQIVSVTASANHGSQRKMEVSEIFVTYISGGYVLSKGIPQYHHGNQVGKDGKKVQRRLILDRCIGASTPGVV